MLLTNNMSAKELITTIVERVSNNGYSSLEDYTVDGKHFTMGKLPMYKWTAKFFIGELEFILSRDTLGVTTKGDLFRQYWCLPITEGMMYALIYEF